MKKNEVERKEMDFNPFTLAPHSHEKFLYLSAFDMHHWYADLSSHSVTMKTQFLPLSHSAIERMVSWYREYSSSSGSLSFSPFLLEIEKQIDSLLGTFPSASAFVRLSTQSPKDVGRQHTDHFRAEQLVQEEYRCAGFPRDANSKVSVLFRAIGKMMKVHSGKEALELLLKSDRVHRSLLHSMNQRDGSAEEEVYIVLREWKEWIDLAREFRTFVVSGKLCAISQYNDWCYYPELHGKEEIIRNRIQNFYEDKVKPLLPEAYKKWACIVDFALEKIDETGGDILVVEINPFGPATGAGLFDWNAERILLQGGMNVWGDLEGGLQRDEIAVRVRDKPRKDVDEEFVQSIASSVFLYGEDEEEEDEEVEREDEEEMDQELEKIDLQKLMEEGIRNACGGRYQKDVQEELVQYVETKLREMDEKTQQWEELQWEYTRKSVRQWIRYKSSTF